METATKYKNIERLFNVVNRSLFRVDGKLDYNRLTNTITRLCDVLADTETDEDVWAIGEFTECSLSDLIVGAYWHYSEWHSGQWSTGYFALCALGRIVNPGMTGIEKDNDAYLMLNSMAKDS